MTWAKFSKINKRAVSNKRDMGQIFEKNEQHNVHNKIYVHGQFFLKINIRAYEQFIEKKINEQSLISETRAEFPKINKRAVSNKAETRAKFPKINKRACSFIR